MVRHCCPGSPRAGIFLLLFFSFFLPVCSFSAPFDFAALSDIAKNVAEAEYQAPKPLPAIVKNLNYDQWRSIGQKPDKALWGGTKKSFNLQFFHPGFVYDRMVKINVVSNGDFKPLPIERSWFDYRGLSVAPQIPEQMSAAGFRVHSPLKTKTYLDEFLVFLGGSYLRAVGKNDKYGLSARGLALDTGLSKGEEFPWFREFWVVEPEAKDKTLTIYALLDGPSVAGAYRFIATPGKDTVIEVKSRLFFRKNVTKVGIAPLTSMFFFGENNPQPGMNDFRPEVHDSDGLQIQFNNGEWLWRPLKNPHNLEINSFSGERIKGFGLLQRDRQFSSYEDLEAFYHQRPGLWIEPLADWGAGKVELVQIPTKDEIHDNIVAYWVADQPVLAGDSKDFSYRMVWGQGDSFMPPAGRVIATRTSIVDGGLVRRFVVDFSGSALTDLTEDTPLSANVSCNQGATVRHIIVQKNTINNSWRLSFELVLKPESALERVLPDNSLPIEIRAFLNNGTDVLSETWSYSASRKVAL